MVFDSLASLAAAAQKDTLPLWRIVCDAECRQSGLAESAEFEKMRVMWSAMLSSAADYEPQRRSASGLTGGDGGRFAEYAAKRASVCGPFLSDVIACALKTAESNACMKRIVAAPTAGSCGVLPAVLVPLYKAQSFTGERIVESLFTAAGVGQVIANRASIAGAEGGCQAEIGAASAMAAATLVELYGGTPQQSCYAAGFALQNLLGLVCDPVAGLVEVPCVKRNVVGAMNACSCADMALAGLVPRIPPDEVIDAMKQVGDKMDVSLKETGRGGMAATPSAREIAKKLLSKE